MKRLALRAAALVLAGASLLSAEEPSEKPRRPDVDLFSVEYRYLPRLHLSDPTPGTAEENARVQPRAMRARAALPWRKKTERWTFSAALAYERLEFGLDGFPSNDAFPRGPYQTFQLPVSFSRSLANPKWGVRAFLSPGVSTDGHGSVGDAFRLQGGAFWERRNRGGALSMGLVLINDYGVPRVLPGISWSGEVADRQTVVVRLPVLVSWSYKATDALDWGLAARVTGGNFQIGRPGIFEDDQLKYSAGTVGPFVRRAFGRWAVGLEGGYVFLHDLEVRHKRHRVRDYDLDRSAFAALTLRLGL